MMPVWRKEAIAKEQEPLVLFSRGWCPVWLQCAFELLMNDTFKLVDIERFVEYWNTFAL
jgi:hypothetical protein